MLCRKFHQPESKQVKHAHSYEQFLIIINIISFFLLFSNCIL